MSSQDMARDEEMKSKKGGTEDDVLYCICICVYDQLKIP